MTFSVLRLMIPLSFLIFSCQEKIREESDFPGNALRSVPEIEQLDALILETPNHGELWLERGKLFSQLKQFPKAIEDFSHSLTLDSSRIETWHLLADAHLDDLDSKKALETLETASQLFENHIPTLLKLAEFQLILRQYEASLATLSKIQETEPHKADVFFLQGLIWKETGDTLKSIRAFQLATRENAQFTDAWINLGQLLEAQKNPDALRYYEAGLAVAPGNLLLMLAKAQYFAKHGRVEESKIIYRQMMELDPLNADPYYDLGLLFLEQDSLNQARDHFDLCLKIDPQYTRAYFYRGVSRELMGDHSGAIKDYEQTLRFNPDDPEASTALKNLKE